MTDNRLDEVLRECIYPLRPYLNQLVVAGGWVPYLYTKLYEDSVANEPLLTSDFDVAIVRRGLLEGEVSLDESILDSGFSYDFASLDTPPVVKYVKELGDGLQAEIEFITEAANTGKSVEVVGSINAQALRDVDVLLDEPWVQPLARFGVGEEGELRLPRPSMFVIHKVLVAPRRRRREKTAKDLYYAFYVLDTFPSWRDRILREVEGFAADRQRQTAKAVACLDEMFRDIDSKGMTLLASQRPQTAYQFMDEDQFCRYALSRMRELRRALSADETAVVQRVP